MRSTGIVKGVTLLYFNTVIRWTHFKDMKKRLGGDWTKSHLFLYKRMCAYCFINMQNLELGSDLWDCEIGLYHSSAQINQLFNTKNSFYNYLLEKLLWNE